MTVLALDWNATRIRAVLGAEGTSALPVPLAPPDWALPTIIALDASVPAIGTPGLRRSRTVAHELCESFLPYLTEKPGQGPRWQSAHLSLDAHAACELVWRKLHPLAANADGIVLTVPDYLRSFQAETLRKLGERMRLPTLGSVPASLAAASAGRMPRAHSALRLNDGALWQSSTLVLDVDEHALTLGWVKTLGDRVHLVESRSCPHLGLRHWRDRLIDGLSDRFVLEHRRDPRDAPLAEQSLFDQLELLADAALEHRSMHLGVQGREWFKHLLVHPSDVAHFCRPLLQKAVAEAEQVFQGWSSAEWPLNALLTHAAGRLPGLADALRGLAVVNPSAETRLPQIKATAFDDADFGDSLLLHDDEPTVTVNVLAPEAPARAAHALASSFRSGALPRGHLESIVPLPLQMSVVSRSV